jgi:hypothetical protein
VALALRRLISSSERQSPEDRLIDCWIAFEALFAHDSNTELRFRATLRIARYVGRDAKDRRDIFHTLRQAYDWRSRIVHGSDPERADPKKLGNLEDAITACEQLLRRALREWLVDPPSSDLREIDDSFLD